MQIKDMLQGLVKVTSGLGLDVIKVTTKDSETIIESVNSERTVIMKGLTSSPVEGLIDGTFGLSNLGLLEGILNLSTFTAESASIDIKTNKTENIEEFVFKNGNSKASYRVMIDRAVPKQPNFKEPTWDVELEPSKDKVQEFADYSSVFGAVTKMFKPEIHDNDLQFIIGDTNASNHSGVMGFGEVAANELKGSFSYPIDKTLRSLKLVNTCDVTLKFSSLGVAQIDVDTGMFNLSFILPGHSA